MTDSQGFEEWQEEVNADPAIVRLARDRRDMFKKGLSEEAEITDFVASGSIARGSQIEPINDVDLIAVYDADAFPDWGTDGTSAAEALEDLAGRIRSNLGQESDVKEPVRLVKPGNHAVKCWIDDPDDDPAFTVDVVPALEQGGHFIIPESASETWIETDPQFLLDAVAGRQEEWSLFVPSIRVLKRWSRDQATTMLPLVVEVLALSHLKVDDRPKALASWFTAAAAKIDTPIEDPSGVGGVIQPDLDTSVARRALDKAADLAWEAIEAAEEGNGARAQCLWRKLFGDAFPPPPGGCGGKVAGVGLGIAGTRGRRPVRDAAQG